MRHISSTSWTLPIGLHTDSSNPNAPSSSTSKRCQLSDLCWRRSPGCIAPSCEPRSEASYNSTRTSGVNSELQRTDAMHVASRAMFPRHSLGSENGLDSTVSLGRVRLGHGRCSAVVLRFLACSSFLCLDRRFLSAFFLFLALFGPGTGGELGAGGDEASRRLRTRDGFAMMLDVVISCLCG